MDIKFDDSELACEADKLIQNFQKDASREAEFSSLDHPLNLS